MIHTKNLVQAALLIALMLAVPKAFPSIRANTCKTCYVDYENGNDSWSGTTETFQGGVVGPWKHAPGMLGILPSGTSSGDGCSGNCATQSPVTGDRYILKGGVVWPYTTLPWLFSANGTSSTQKYGCAGPGCIYVGNAIGAGLSAWNKGIVNSIVLTRDLGGWNPASPPTIACSGGGGSGAAATPLVIPASSNDPLIATFIYHINLTAQGSGYTSAPNCAISGGGGSATLAADIDRAVIDAGATQSNPPHWPVDGSRTPYCPGVSNYDIVSGIECRNILIQAYTGSVQVAGFIGGSSHSTTTNFYIHGLHVDCAWPTQANCPSSLSETQGAVSAYSPYSEISYGTIENGDDFILGTGNSTICGAVNTPCEYGQFGVQTGSESGNGPVEIQHMHIYGGDWQIRLVGNAQNGSTDPYLVHDNELWLSMYTTNTSAHINRRQDGLATPATLISYNNIDHNHVEGSGNIQNCPSGVTYYFFNEVIWGTGTSSPAYGFDNRTAGTGGGGGGCRAYLYNDTLYNPTNPYNCLNSDNAVVATTIVLQNIHCISGPSVVDPFAGSASDVTFENQAGSSNPAVVQAASTVQSVSTANAQGYTWSNLYGPTSASNATVTFASGTGSSNLSSLCSGALAALCADINGNPRPASGAAGWQAGAYVYGSGGSSPVAAPTGLTAVVE